MLADADINIYEKFLYEDLSLKEFSQWKDAVFVTEQERPKSNSTDKLLSTFSDRGNFVAYMANQFSYLQMKEWLQNNKREGT